MKKTLLGVSVLALGLLFGCSNAGEEPKEDKVATEETDTTENTVDEVTEGAVTEGETFDEAVADGKEGYDLPTSEEEVFELAKLTIEENTKAAEDEDIEAYLSTLGLDGETLEMVKAQTEYLFSSFDLVYTLEDVTLVFVSEDFTQVEISAKQTTKTVEDDDTFIDNSVVATHTLQYIDGKYRIVLSVADESSIEALEEIPALEETESTDN